MIICITWWASLVAQMLRNMSRKWEPGLMPVWEDPLEKVISFFFLLFALFREEIDILRIEFIY